MELSRLGIRRLEGVLGGSGMLLLMLVVIGLFVVLEPATVNAYGSVEDEVEDLYYQSLDEYDDFQLDEAKALLDQALSVADQGNLKNTLTAQIHLQLGVILYAEGDVYGAQDEFAQAINDDPYIELDPLMSSPSLQKVFDEMKAQGPADVGGLDELGDDPGSDYGYGYGTPPAQPMAPSGPALSHQPVLQAVHGVGVALYLEVPAGLPVARVFAVYRKSDSPDWNSVEMEPRGRLGFAAAIPGHDVSGDSIFYHIEVMDAGGNIVASAGTANNPYRIVLSAGAPPPPPPPPASSYPSAGHGGGYQGQQPAAGQYGGGYGYGAQSGASSGGGSSPSYWQAPESQGAYESQRSTRAAVEVGSYSNPDRAVSISLEGGLGFGVAKGPTLRTANYVNVGPGLAWSSIAQLKVDGGYFINSNVQVGLGARIQMIGDEDAGLVVEPMLTAKGRYFRGITPDYRFFVGGGAGLGSVQHTVNLGDQFGGYLDTTRAGGREALFGGFSGFHAMGLAGMEYSISNLFTVVGGLDLYFLFPNFSVHTDLNVGVALSF